MANNETLSEQNDTPRPLVWFAWLVVSLPLLWGVWETLKKASALFR
jgi:hypothetical protein